MLPEPLDAIFDTYVDESKKEFRWRLIDGNEKIIADGSEGYVSNYNVERGIMNVVETIVEAYNSIEPEEDEDN